MIVNSEKTNSNNMENPPYFKMYSISTTKWFQTMENPPYFKMYLMSTTKWFQTMENHDNKIYNHTIAT